jgi:2-methylaconitate cis-trans-isomerase PrpF
MSDPSSYPTQFLPRLHHGVVEFPVHHMRGGTSTGLVLWDQFTPDSPVLREELLRHLMGTPLAERDDKNRQITGLGRGIPTSNKVFLADVKDTGTGPTIVSTLAQLAKNHPTIDWSVNCGNMSAALQLWALDTGLVKSVQSKKLDVRIDNTNTGIVTVSRMAFCDDGRWLTAEIPGVSGAYPAVDLFLQSPVGAKTGHLLPTGAVAEAIEGYTVSCVDVAVPMVICDAGEFGKTAHEPVQELESDEQFKLALRRVWVAAGLRMQLKRRDGTLMSESELERSETIPKICIVGAPRQDGNLAVRYFTPQAGHGSMAVSGGCCLAAAALIPGSIAHRVARHLPSLSSEYADLHVGIENPAGILDTTVIARMNGAILQIQSAAYRRNTQILLRGHVPLYRASPELVQALLSRATQIGSFMPQ